MAIVHLYNHAYTGDTKQGEEPKMETTAQLDRYIASQIEARPVEANIIKRVYNTLKAAGKPVAKTWDTVDIERVNSLEETYTIAFNLDEVYLIVKTGSWVRLTMGEEWDLICDYTTDLEDYLKPVFDWIEKNQD